MAQIDVSELVSDPDFTDAMQVISRVPTVNALGENTLVETTFDSFGSVQPASGRTIQRLPDALRVANVSSFWFKGAIVASAPGQYPSILTFRGVRYQVQLVFDWSNWGAGYTEGVCVAEVPAA